MSALTDTFTLSNGLTIPQVGFGTWQIPSGDAAYNATAAALEAGYRHVDTAYAYGNEESVGAAVRDSGLPREEVFVTSKLPASVKTTEGALDHFRQTNENLGLGYVDLFLIHAPWTWGEFESDDAGNLAAWSALETVYAEGKARAIGVSNFDVHDLQNLLDHAETAPTVNQIQYYVGFTEPKITEFSTEHDILVEAYSPLATGDLLNNAEVKGIADAHDATVAQVALRFCLQNGVLPLPKATGVDHIKANAELDFTLSDAEMTTLNAMPDGAPDHGHNPTQG